MIRNVRKIRGWLAMALALAACGDDGGDQTGSVRVMLEAEVSVRDGIDVGSGEEDMRDYAVRFTKYLATIGDVELSRGSDGKRASLGDTFVADLKRIAESGAELGTIDELATGQWDHFSYHTGVAEEDTRALAGVSDADLQTMIDGGFTYWIEGSVERPESEGGPVRFVIQTDAAAMFSDCQANGRAGLNVVSGSPSSVKLTLHGDHIFFNAFPGGSEASVQRGSGWLLEADLNDDGEVTTEELADADATELFAPSKGYNLAGAPAAEDGTTTTILSALDFVRAQLSTQGHFQGEGECIATLD